MAVITQYYDIDLKATGEYPVVKMSQFDTGSRTIVFTVYDGHDLAQIDGMVARVDGTRSDGVEFSSTCTVGTGSKVSFTINQEMTKHAGKHAAELVIFDADGDPAGTQNFIIEVEAATMVRDSAASADDRTLYDQFTDSVSKTVADKMTSVDGKMAGIDTQISTTVDTEIDKRIKPDPLLGAWSDYTIDGTASFAGDNTEHVIPLKIKSQSNGADAVYGSNTANAIYIYKPGVYQMTAEGFYNGNVEVTSRVTVLKLFSNSAIDSVKRRWVLTGAQGIGTTGAKSQIFRGAITFCVPDDSLPYRMEVYTNGSSAVTLDSNTLSQVVVTRISSGSDILEQGVDSLTIGTVTTGAPGTQASVVNSGTAKDVVLDFTIPRGADGYTLPAATSTTLGGVKVGAGINVSADGTIDVNALVDRISQMQSKYDALISNATYEVGSGLTKGRWYNDYTWDFCRLRVVGGVCTLSFSVARKASAWNAKAWDRAQVLILPDGLGSLGEIQVPIVTNANGEPNNNTALQIVGNDVSIRPTVGVQYNTGSWFQGTVSWVAAGSRSRDLLVVDGQAAIDRIAAPESK